MVELSGSGGCSSADRAVLAACRRLDAVLCFPSEASGVDRGGGSLGSGLCLSDASVGNLLRRAEGAASDAESLAAELLQKSSVDDALGLSRMTAAADAIAKKAEELSVQSKRLRLGGSCAHGADKGPSCEKCLSSREGRLRGPYVGYPDGLEVADYMVRKLRRVKGGRKASVRYLARLDALSSQLNEVDELVKRALRDAQNSKKRAERLQAVALSRNASSRNSASSDARRAAKRRRRRIRRAGVSSEDEESQDESDQAAAAEHHVDAVKKRMNVDASLLRSGYTAVAREELNSSLLARTEERACDANADDVLVERERESDAARMSVRTLESHWAAEAEIGTETDTGRDAIAADEDAEEGDAAPFIIPFLIRCEDAGVNVALQASVGGKSARLGASSSTALTPGLGTVLDSIKTIHDVSVAAAMTCAQIAGREPAMSHDMHLFVQSETSGLVTRELIPGTLSISEFTHQFGYLGHQMLHLSSSGQVTLCAIRQRGEDVFLKASSNPSPSLVERYKTGCMYLSSLELPRPLGCSSSPEASSIERGFEFNEQCSSGAIMTDPCAGTVGAFKRAEADARTAPHSLAVDFRRCGFEGGHALAVSVCCLLRSECIADVSFRGTDLSVDGGFMTLASVVPTMKRLQRLDVSLNPLSSSTDDAVVDPHHDGVAALLLGLCAANAPARRTLQVLDISHVPLLDARTVDCAPKRAAAVAALLDGCEKLHTLRACGVMRCESPSISSACSAMLMALHLKRAMAELTFRSNRLPHTHECFRAAASALRTWKSFASLVELHTSGFGVRALAPDLAVKTLALSAAAH